VSFNLENFGTQNLSFHRPQFLLLCNNNFRTHVENKQALNN